MEKMTGISSDITLANIEKLGDLFPNVISDGKVDFDALRAILGDAVDTSKEKFQFCWNGKSESVRIAQTPSTSTLRADKDKSKNWNSTNNLYIEGDNLEVLKTLQKTYYGRIKAIYIDPPYNTGKDFVYKDNYANPIENYILQTNQDKKSNPETDGRFHSNWLNLMFPRLLLARNLLRSDGVIFISIDNNEVDNLRHICNEVFGENNFVGTLILKTATDNNPSQINTEHEYMLCYAKSIAYQGNWLRTSEAAQLIIDKYNDLKSQGLTTEQIQNNLRKWINGNKQSLPQVAHYNCVDDKGVYSSSGNSSNPHPGGYMYDILHPTTHKPVPKPQNGWRWPEKTFWEYADSGEVTWGKDETTQPHIKKRIETATDYLRSLIYEDNRGTTMALSELFDGNKVFDNPKPVGVLKRIIDYVTDKDSIVLDFFSGSATTADAVMQLNSEDNGTRKFILVQIPELTDEDSVPYSLGYYTLCDIGEERIRRAGEKIKKEWEEKNSNLPLVSLDEAFKGDIGFKVFKLDSTNINPWDNSAEYDENTIYNSATVFKLDRTKEDILYEIMLKYGVFDQPVSEELINGKTLYRVGQRHMIVCLEDNVDGSDIAEICKLSPRVVVFKEDGFSNDNDKINAEYNLKNAGVEDVKCI